MERDCEKPRAKWKGCRGGQAASGVVCLSSNTGRPFLQTEAAYFWGQFPLRTTAGGKVE